MGGGQAVHDWWTLVRVAATKLQLQLELSVWQLQMSMSCKPLGLHNKFTNLCNLHKNFKKFFIFLVILRIDFFENL